MNYEEMEKRVEELEKTCSTLSELVKIIERNVSMKAEEVDRCKVLLNEPRSTWKKAISHPSIRYQGGRYGR